MVKKKCQICKARPVNRRMSNHHLVPKFNGNSRYGKTPMCIYCHQQIHDLFTNKELFETFHTLPALRKEFAMRLAGVVMNGFNFLTDEVDEGYASVAQSGRAPALYHVAGERIVGGSTPLTGFEIDIQSHEGGL